MSKQKKTKYYIVSFSGGKDSTAMLLRMMELGTYQIDEVINMDTGMKFPAVYEHIEKIKLVLKKAGIKYTSFKSDKSFEYYLLDHEYTDREGNPQKGYSWTRALARWCTSLLKENIFRPYRKKLKEQYYIYEYVGLAADEQYRLERTSNKNKHHIHPLVDWGWTEKDALQYCYDKGYDGNGLYKIFARCSCWCCPLQRIGEARKLWEHFPDLWAKLKEMDSKTRTPWKMDWSVERLEQRFMEEARQTLLDL